MLAPTCPAQLASGSALAADAGPTSASDSTTVASAAGFRILAPFVVRPCGRSYARARSGETRSATVLPPCCHGSFAAVAGRALSAAFRPGQPGGVEPRVREPALYPAMPSPHLDMLWLATNRGVLFAPCSHPL